MNQENAVLQVISAVTKIKEAPCKKKIQKLVYLIEERKLELGFDYKLHIYGPYSADLDYTICELKAENYLNITYTNKGHILKCVNPIPDEMPQEMRFVIDTFGTKTPLELELLTTALYAERYLENSTDNTISEAVKRIKGNKFPEKKIRNAIDLLKETGYIVS